MPSHFLSKSQYLRGLQCHKSLWLLKDGKVKRNEPTESLQAIFDEGTRVGEKAQKLFPGGKVIKFKGSTFNEKIEKTKEYIASGESTIYEATFKFDDILVMVDILNKGENSWEIYEVKSASDVFKKKRSREVKDVFLNDVAIQYYVLKGNGLNISSASLVHINNKYIRNGSLEIDKLFSIVDLTEEVADIQNDVVEQLQKLRSILSTDKPDIGIGIQCDKPYECDFKEHCWSNIPKYSIFNIGGLTAKKKFELFESGIVEIRDIPSNFPLSDNQRLQVEVEKTSNKIIDQREVKQFLEQLFYPLYFLDFETFSQTIPEWDGIKPYQAIPFQYSIHYIEEEHGELFHLEFLAKEGSDPRKNLAEKLVQDIPKGVCVFAYNCGFEKGVIKKLAESFPEYSEHLMDIHNNILDLMVPFQKKHYYTPEMQGSYSIKYVLPALISDDPELDYKALEISNGMEASNTYANLHLNQNEDEVITVRADLLQYCWLDTYAMVKLFDKLKEISQG